MKTHWTTPVERIKTVQCIYCGDTGSVEWAGKHLEEKKYHLLPTSKLKSRRGHQFNVIERNTNG
jgi:hypothetical protein